VWHFNHNTFFYSQWHNQCRGATAVSGCISLLKLLGFVKCTAAHHWVGKKNSKHYLPLTPCQTSKPVHLDNTIKHNSGSSASVLSCRGDVKLLDCHSVWFKIDVMQPTPTPFTPPDDLTISHQLVYSDTNKYLDS